MFRGCVLNKSKPRGSPLKLSLVSSLCFVLGRAEGAFLDVVASSQRLRHVEWGRHVLEGLSKRTHGLVAPGKTTCERVPVSYVDILSSRVLFAVRLKYYVCQDCPKTST